MSYSHILNLSIGDQVPDRRLTANAYSGVATLNGRQVRIDVSAEAVQALADSPVPVVTEVELYFSCLVRKQMRFRQLSGVEAQASGYARVIPGLYATFRAVTTKHCAISDADDQPPVEAMPVRHPERFVPDWIRIDCRGGRWLGEYGFARREQPA